MFRLRGKYRFLDLLLKKFYNIDRPLGREKKSQPPKTPNGPRPAYRILHQNVFHRWIVLALIQSKLLLPSYRTQFN